MKRAIFCGLALAMPAAWSGQLPALGGADVDVHWYAQEVAGGRVLGERARSPLAAASLIKLLIALVVLEELSRETLHWQDRIAVSERDVVDGSPSFSDRGGTMAPLAALTGAMLSQSDNTAANALLSHLGFGRCNAAAQAFGLPSTKIERRFYDWEAERRGLENVSSPRDISELLLYFDRTARSPSDSRAADAASIMGYLYRQEDRETIPAALPGRRIANKTGELPGFRHDAAIVGSWPKQYVLAVMTRFRADRSDAVEAIRRLAVEVDRRLGTG